ncbi:MAG TPA: C-terminal helicase domain-containing protein, partial [Ktedonobacteraceae bacterium]
GNKSQRAREDVLTAFRRGQIQTLLATNVAARGLDIQGIYQVINYELPESSDLFTHRIGRTGRMGKQGKAITLLVPSDVPKWRRMARNLGQVVLLQRLTIDEEVSNAVPYATAEVAGMLEREHYNEQRPVRNNRPSFAPDQDHGRRGRPEYDSHRAPDFKRRQKEHTINETPAWQSEDAPSTARPQSDGIGDDRRGTRKTSSIGRSAGKHKARSFATTEAHQPDRRKPGTSTRRMANRSASY